MTTRRLKLLTMAMTLASGACVTSHFREGLQGPRESLNGAPGPVALDLAASEVTLLGAESLDESLAIRDMTAEAIRHTFPGGPNAMPARFRLNLFPQPLGVAGGWGVRVFAVLELQVGPRTWMQMASADPLEVEGFGTRSLHSAGGRATRKALALMVTRMRNDLETVQ